MTDDAAATGGPGGPAPAACVFAKALMAAQACCECSRRSAIGERLQVHCVSPPAHANCSTLLALLQERSRFALRLPPPGRPITHMQALRLQCGGLAALRQLDDADAADADAPGADDVHRLLLAARRTHGSLTELPWAELVPRVAAWRAHRRHQPGVRP